MEEELMGSSQNNLSQYKWHPIKIPLGRIQGTFTQISRHFYGVQVHVALLDWGYVDLMASEVSPDMPYKSVQSVRTGRNSTPRCLPRGMHTMF